MHGHLACCVHAAVLLHTVPVVGSMCVLLHEWVMFVARVEVHKHHLTDAVLCCAVLCCPVLCCAVLCRAALCCAVLRCVLFILCRAMQWHVGPISAAMSGYCSTAPDSTTTTVEHLKGHQSMSTPDPRDTRQSMGVLGHRRRASCNARPDGLLAVEAPS